MTCLLLMSSCSEHYGMNHALLFIDCCSRLYYSDLFRYYSTSCLGGYFFLVVFVPNGSVFRYDATTTRETLLVLDFFLTRIFICVRHFAMRKDTGSLPEREPAKDQKPSRTKWHFPTYFTHEGSVTFPFNVIDVLHARTITSWKKNSRCIQQAKNVEKIILRHL